MLAKALHALAVLRPVWASRRHAPLMLGEVASVVTAGQKVLPRKAQELGYRFKYPELAEALRDVFTAQAGNQPVHPAQAPWRRGAGQSHH